MWNMRRTKWKKNPTAAATYDRSVLHGVCLPTDCALLQQQSGHSASSSSHFPPLEMVSWSQHLLPLETNSKVNKSWWQIQVSDWFHLTFTFFIRIVRWVECQVGWNSNARHLCAWFKLIGLNLTIFQWHFHWIWVKNDQIFIRIVGRWNWNWVEVERSSTVPCKFVDRSVRCLLLLKIVQFHPISVN